VYSKMANSEKMILKTQDTKRAGGKSNKLSKDKNKVCITDHMDKRAAKLLLGDKPNPVDKKDNGKKNKYWVDNKPDAYKSWTFFCHLTGAQACLFITLIEVFWAFLATTGKHGQTLGHREIKAYWAQLPATILLVLYMALAEIPLLGATVLNRCCKSRCNLSIPEKYKMYKTTRNARGILYIIGGIANCYFAYLFVEGSHVLCEGGLLAIISGFCHVYFHINDISVIQQLQEPRTIAV